MVLAVYFLRNQMFFLVCCMCVSLSFLLLVLLVGGLAPPELIEEAVGARGWQQECV